MFACYHKHFLLLLFFSLFLSSTGIAVDKNGLIFFVDGTTIRKVDQNGIISTFLGSNDLTSARPLTCDNSMDINQVSWTAKCLLNLQVCSYWACHSATLCPPNIPPFSHLWSPTDRGCYICCMAHLSWIIMVGGWQTHRSESHVQVSGNSRVSVVRITWVESLKICMIDPSFQWTVVLHFTLANSCCQHPQFKNNGNK